MKTKTRIYKFGFTIELTGSLSRSLLILIFGLSLSSSLFSQYTDILIRESASTGKIEWNISSESGQLMYSGTDFQMDSAYFELKSELRYFLNVSISDVNDTSQFLLTLEMSGLPLIHVSSNLDPGDYTIPFYTGYYPSMLKIIGGTDADIADYPWQVFYRSGKYICGGSIIDEEWVVTAAHCTKDDENVDIPASQMTVKAGATNRYSSTEGKTYEISQVIVHESYNTSNYNNDIALLKLKTPIDIDNAAPVKLISQEEVDMGATDPGVMATVTGWGITSVDPEVFPQILQMVELPIVSNQTASIVWGSIPSTILMAGYRNGSKDACSGDSGGPLVVSTLNGFKLAGIVSWGNETCNTYGGYTRVSKYLDWIENKSGISTRFKPQDPVGENLICAGAQSTSYETTVVAGAQGYDWQVLPESAGTALADDEYCEVFWDPDFTGKAYTMVRIIFNQDTSDYAVTEVEVLKGTTVLGQTGDSTLCEGNIINLHTVATGYNLNFQWFFNGSILPGATSEVYGISGSTTENSGAYYCSVSGYCGTVNSDSIEVLVLPGTRINSFPDDQEYAYGDQAILQVEAAGHDIGYTWYKDDRVLEETNSPSLVLDNLNASDIGLYSVQVSGTCGQVTSDPVYLYVLPPEPFKNKNAWIWPNPAGEITYVALRTNEPYNIFVVNGNGKLVYSVKNCRNQTVIPVSELGQGFYYVKIHYNNKMEVLKLIVY